MMLLNGKGAEVDLLKVGNLSLLHEAAKLGNRHPLLLLITSAAAHRRGARHHPGRPGHGQTRARGGDRGGMRFGMVEVRV